MCNDTVKFMKHQYLRPCPTQVPLPEAEFNILMLLVYNMYQVSVSKVTVLRYII